MKHIEHYQYSAKELACIVDIIGNVHGSLFMYLNALSERIPPKIMNIPMGDSNRSINDIITQMQIRLDQLHGVMPLVGPWMLSENHSLRTKWVERLSTLERLLERHNFTVNDFINYQD